MAVIVSDVFSATMSLMDELNEAGAASTANTKEYENRTPGILNTLLGEYRIRTGQTKDYALLTGKDDSIVGIAAPFCRAALPYGLAAHLLTDENPQAASFYLQRYEELRDIFILRQPAESVEIEDVYGVASHPYNDFARW